MINIGIFGGNTSKMMRARARGWDRWVGRRLKLLVESSSPPLSGLTVEEKESAWSYLNTNDKVK